jgi:uncharacterized repeat protein (TIGR03943 family)
MGCGLLVWIAVFFWLLSEDRYQSFLRPEFWVLLLWALVIMVAFLVAVFIYRWPSKMQRKAGPSWVRMAVLFLPVAYMVSNFDTPLGSYAFKTRMTPGVPRYGEETETARAIPKKDGVLTLAEIFQDFGAHRGKRVTTEGMVAKENGTPAGSFILFRFLIVCCVADAQPVGVIVSHEDASSLKEEAWVRVEGILDLKMLQGHEMPHIYADRITEIEGLKNPYMYRGLF